MPSAQDARITVMANPDCAHCLHLLDLVTEEAARLGVAVAALDLRQHPEASQAWNAETSPLVVLDHVGPEDVHLPFHERHRIVEAVDDAWKRF